MATVYSAQRTNSRATPAVRCLLCLMAQDC